MKMVDQDEEHLKLLSIFHYVWGGLTACGCCLGALYAVMGGVFMTFAAQQHGPNAPPAFLGGVFVLVGGFIVLLAGTFAALSIFAGRSLARRKHYTFCFV